MPDRKTDAKRALERLGEADAKRALRRLGETVVFLRKALDLTQEEVAGDAGLTSRYLQMVERGSANPSYISLLALARALHVELIELIERARLDRGDG